MLENEGGYKAYIACIFVTWLTAFPLISLQPPITVVSPSPTAHAWVFLFSQFIMSLSLFPLWICILLAAGNDLWLGAVRCHGRSWSEVRDWTGGRCLSPFELRTGSHGHYKSLNILSLSPAAVCFFSFFWVLFIPFSLLPRISTSIKMGLLVIVLSCSLRLSFILKDISRYACFLGSITLL